MCLFINAGVIWAVYRGRFTLTEAGGAGLSRDGDGSRDRGGLATQDAVAALHVNGDWSRDAAADVTRGGSRDTGAERHVTADGVALVDVEIGTSVLPPSPAAVVMWGRVPRVNVLTGCVVVGVVAGFMAGEAWVGLGWTAVLGACALTVIER